ncbi:MAG: IS1634 family transposase [Chloroflexi bacterium]|nr:IS1634 family transposase [Chloroflexota bacterium]
MYLRTTQQRRKDGRVVRYLQLAESYRNVSGQTVARVVSHLGREDRVDRAGLERLVASISRFLGSEVPITAGDGVDGAGFALEAAWELGGPHVVAALWEELGLAKTLRRAARRGRFRSDVERAVLVMVAQRCLEPGSKLQATRWLSDEVRLPGISEVSDDQLYRAMDFLLEQSEAVQEAVFGSVANLLNLEVDLVFFDTTSTYFEVEPDADTNAGDVDDANGSAVSDADGALRHRGHSKDSRPDLPQVVIGLAVTKTGIPVRCWVWPGNTNDQTVVEQVRDDLRGWKLGNSVFVGDSGFAARENLAYLKRAGGHYLVGIRMRSGMPEVEAALARQGRYLHVADNLSVKEVWLDRGSAGERRFIVCRNDDEARRDKARRDQQLERLETELAALKTLDTDAHHKRECALRAHPSLGRLLAQTPTGRLTIDRDKIKTEARLDGKYLIETSDRTLSAADAALAYKNLNEAERSFRDLKGRIGLRPVYHRLDDRIRAHVLVCFLALLLIRVCETRSGHTWPVQRRILRRIKLARFHSKDGRFDQRTELDAEQKTLLSALNVAEPARVSTLSV